MDFLDESQAAMNLPRGLREYQAWRREVSVEAERQEAEERKAWKSAAPARRKAASNERSAKRRLAEKMQTPSWADKNAIQAIYMEAQRLTTETGIPHHVDHEYPLRGKLVSGLHVEANLRILPALENCRKRNRFEVE